MTTATRRRPSPSASRAPSTSLREAVVFCLTAAVGLRSITVVAALIADALPSLTAQGVPGWPAPPIHPGPGGLFSAFERFDALWFLRIADDGYRVGDGSAAFFPAFPLATRAVSVALGGHPLAAATVVSNASFVIALFATHRLAEDAVGRDGARFATIVLCAFPTSYFFMLPYSESLFLAFAATSILAARRRRWAIAAISGALAAATRSIGIALVPVLIVEALQQRSEGRRSFAPLLAGPAVALGTLSYAAWWHVVGGDAAIPLTKQQLWQRSFSWPWETIWDAARITVDRWGHPAGGYWALDLAIVVPVIGLAVLAAWRLRPAYAVYVWASLLGPMLFVYPGRPLMSMPRFAATLFPITWVAADLTHDRPVARVAIVVAGIAAMLALCVLTLNWFYVF
ncbi:MAG TPA: mannosyltransferase family protein [Actinomycetota bacterium]|nr:mannosyltransferase family protein [Actinomycetota bacterium]